MVIGGLLGVVAGVLAVGGFAKLRAPGATAPMLRSLGLPSGPWAARALGSVELGVGVAAFLLGGWLLAAIVAVLFAAFTVAILRLRAAGPEAASCGCFGRSSAPPTLIHAVVDAAAAAVAVAAAVTDAPGFLSMRPDLPLAGVPQLVCTYVAVALAVAVLTVLPETVVAARRTPASESAARLRTFSVEAPLS